MVLNVPSQTVGSDIDVEYDEDNNTLSVSYSFNNKSVSFSNTVVETVPEDADTDTINARVVNGVLTVTMDVLPEVEEELDEVDHVDPTFVSVKRKTKE
jgi:HSP20 family molecular chaperone IbpA